MIGYGSLISLSSMEQSLGRKYEGPIYRVHLSGYERAWAAVRSFNDPRADAARNPQLKGYYMQENSRIPIDGAAELNIYPQKKGRINAVLYLITGEDLLRFDKREWGYERVEVTDRIEEYRFEGGKVYAYAGLGGPPDKSASDPQRYIIIKEFLDQVIGACDRIGKTFRAEFDESTRPITYPIMPFANIVWDKVR